MTYDSNSPLSLSQMTDNAQYILNYMIGQGWTKQSICAMLGNMQTESTINPGAWENYDSSNTSGGFGLVQWTPSTKYSDWAKGQGLVVDNIDSQLKRILYELSNKIQWYATKSYPMSFQQFTQSTDTPENLAYAWMYNYERPTSLNQPARQTQARYWYTNLTAGTAPAPTPAPTPSPTPDPTPTPTPSPTPSPTPTPDPGTGGSSITIYPNYQYTEGMALTDLNLKTYDKIYPLFIQKYQTLIQDPNANVLDKINQIIDYLNITGNLSNSVVTQWNNVMAWVMNDGLNTDVTNKINTMVSDGTFNTLFNQYLAPSLGDITKLNTNNKSDIVDALNETFGDVQVNTAAIGTLSNLNSTDKSSLVNAINSNASKISPTINTLTNSVLKGKDGTAITIGCWGDSTYWGHASGVAPLGTQTANPAPLVLQKVLQSYFGNTNIVVDNNGVKGQMTSDVMSTWDSTMSASTENVIFINWGINDAKSEGITPENYRSNLRSIIDTARKYNKQVICDIPNVVLSADYAQDGMANYTYSQNVKVYADIMRSVAKEYNCYVIDNYRKTQQYNYALEYIPTTMPDGMHPSDAMYYYKALQMAEPFLAPFCAKVKHNGIISCVDSSVRYFGANAVQINAINRCGFSFMADSAKIAIELEHQSDIFVAMPQWNQGATQCQIVLDGNIIGTVNLQDASMGSSQGYVQNMEVLIGENITPGIHLIELNKLDTDTSLSVGLDFVAIRPPATIKTVKTSVEANGTYTLIKTYKKLEDIELNFSSGTETDVLTDIPTSRLLGNIDLQFTGTLNANEGAFVMGTHRTVSNKPLGGVVLFLNSSGVLNIAEGQASGYSTMTPFGSTVYSSTSHTYRLIITPSGSCTVYVDGTQVGTYTMTTSRIGGYLGFFKGSTGILHMDKVLIRR